MLIFTVSMNCLFFTVVLMTLIRISINERIEISHMKNAQCAYESDNIKDCHSTLRADQVRFGTSNMVRSCCVYKKFMECLKLTIDRTCDDEVEQSSKVNHTLYTSCVDTEYPSMKCSISFRPRFFAAITMISAVILIVLIVCCCACFYSIVFEQSFAFYTEIKHVNRKQSNTIKTTAV